MGVTTDGKLMEKLEGTMYTAPCDCGEMLYVFLTADGRVLPMHPSEYHATIEEDRSRGSGEQEGQA